MQGFDPEYEDLTDYILKCTARIWEGRDIAALDWHYAENLVVRTPAGVTRGNAAGIAATMATLTEFPDRVLLGEDVVWCGDDRAGFLSSHRIVSTATHAGGAFGPATGREVRFRTIADTFCLANRVHDEWLVRDNGAIAVQLGRSPRDVARAWIEEGDTAAPLTPATDVPGPYAESGNDDAWGARHAGLLEALMDAEFGAVEREYDRACRLALPGGVEASGRDAAVRFWMGLRAALPSATFRVEHRIGRHDPMMGPRSAVRWSLTGRHDGRGRYGAPTGAPLHVMGISHVEFGPRGIRSETTVIDDVALWKQILLHAGGHDG